MFGALSSLRRAASQTAARASARAASARRFATSTGPLAAYNDLLLKHPILTKSVTSMCVVGGGDWVAQKFIEGRDAIVWKRVATMGLVGLTLVGPMLHHWFGFLVRVLPGTGAKATIQKTVVDQLLFAPIFNPLFVGYLYLLEGRSDQIVDFLKNDWFSVTVSNWKLWGPAQAINFMFVPARFQVLFANCTAVAWNCFLSWKSHRNEAHEPPAEVAEVASE